MDPISAIGIASSAYSAIVKGFQMGKEVESMAKDMGRWMNAINAVKSGHEKAKSRRKMFGSIEEEALQTFAAKKKADKMEEELRNFIQFNYGVGAWQEVIRIQAKIRKERQELELQKKKKVEEILTWIAVTFGIVVISVILISMIWLVRDGT
jgi:CHASE3 domain sensor protein